MLKAKISLFLRNKHERQYECTNANLDLLTSSTMIFNTNQVKNIQEALPIAVAYKI